MEMVAGSRDSSQLEPGMQVRYHVKFQFPHTNPIESMRRNGRIFFFVARNSRTHTQKNGAMQ